MKDLSLVRANAADACAIRDLTNQAYAKWVSVTGCKPLPMIANHEQSIRDNQIDLLYIDDSLAALIETKIQSDHVLIVNVAVRPVFQRQGFGRLMIAHAEQTASSLGVGKVELYTNRLFAANIDLYEKLGYRIFGEYEIDGRFGVRMRKSLASTSDGRPG